MKKKKNNLFGKIISEKTLSQISKHKKFGGVVPELASREHSKNLDMLVKKCLKSSKLSFCNIDAYAATTGPGLLGALLVGTNYAKALAISTNKPFLSINHLQGHILVSRMKKNIKFPFLCLLVSGGHCQIILARSFNKFKIIGETLDDAVGEVFDKISRIMGLGYPGGPIIEELAKKSKGKFKFDLPRPLFNKKTFNLSFSGLKTSVRRLIESGINSNQRADLAFEFQKVVTECLIKKVELAIQHIKKKDKLTDFILSGGVASNSYIRSEFYEFCKRERMSFFAPEKDLCVDNATMIAWAGIEMLKNGRKRSRIYTSPKPRWRIDKI